DDRDDRPAAPRLGLLERRLAALGGGGHAAAARPVLPLPPDDGKADGEGRQPGAGRIGPQLSTGNAEDEPETDETDAHHGPRPVAMVVDGRLEDRLPAALVRNHEPRGGVEDETAAAEQNKRREGDSVDDGADPEVAGKAGGDSCEHAALGGADELALGVR